MYRRIIVAIDGSDCAGLALEEAAGLARALGAALAIVTVCERPPSFANPGLGVVMPQDAYTAIHEAETEAARRLLERAAERARELGVTPATRIIDAVAAFEGILEGAEEFGADLIVMGSHGRRGLQRLLLGSQAARVLAMSRLPLLVVRGSDAAA